MRRVPWLVSLLALLLPLSPLRAQSMIALTPQQCVWHPGDNPAWAASGFDDSAWQPYSSWQIDDHNAHIWVRCHANLAPLRSLAHPALQVDLEAASQVFVNGSLLGSSGNLATAQFNIGGSYVVPIEPASLTPAATLALRVALRDPQFQSASAGFMLGEQSVLQEHHAAAALSGALSYLPIGLCYGLIGVVGFMLLGLYVTDRSHLELLLLAIVCWLVCDLRLCEFCQTALVPMPSALWNILYSLGELVELFWIPFIFRLAGKRVPWIYWLVIAFPLGFFFNIFGNAFLPPLLNLHQNALYSSIVPWFFAGGMACATAPLAAFWPWHRIPRNLRAVAFFCIAWGAADFLWFLHWELSLLVAASHDALALQNFLLILRAATTLCSVLALLTILFREQRRIAQDRALLAGEMQAAREIQSLLAPATIETIPVLHVDVAFHPMREVGGDFYLCRPLPDGRQRILVGDVSGKGTAAAMTATLLIGAAERRDSDSPAALLHHLNLVLRGSRVGGFATCLCADLAPDGAVTLANAGHLPPYCRAQEIPVLSALPLGVNAPGETAYEETRFTLAPGDTLTFLSDGVVEARNPAGELFGFDRTREISRQSAEEIARAASTHGQQDDITVLTVAFAPAEVAYA
jgi:sigma-B regulation protein RsbU (phosphoserine phosphatase)